MSVTAVGTPRVAYLGARSDHRAGVERLFAAAGWPLTSLDMSLVASRSTAGGGAIRRAARKAGRVLDQMFGTRSRTYLDQLVRQVDEAGTECVLCYWGTDPLADAVALKRLRPKVKVVLVVLCHPLGLSGRTVAMQNWLMRRAARSLDGFVFPTEAMQEYFARHILPRPVASVVIPPCLPAALHPDADEPEQEVAPNLIFLGRMDWHLAQPSDNVGELLDGVMGHGVHVFHHNTPAPVRPSPLRHTFPYRPLDEAIRYCTRFQATLVAYNLAACSRDDRFRLTVPDRLIAAVAAGLPVFLPRTGYDGCKEYLREYPAVLEFSTPADIRDALTDRTSMAALRGRAWEARGEYTAERQFDQLTGFINRLVS